MGIIHRLLDRGPARPAVRSAVRLRGWYPEDCDGIADPAAVRIAERALVRLLDRLEAADDPDIEDGRP